ncbi:MAG: polysaccharide deacetylase family protein [Candidatus Eremiobacteraeota bacterium]|nr:polysaccharide deacetylase family protein [Candidatus Eremiobacteraeota bacterium]
MALTFDDGPNPKATAAILDVLRREHAHATFFVVGEAAAASPELLRRISREGHALGNHTWDHAHLNVLSRSTIDDELARTDDAIFAATGARPRIARPPFGARSFVVLDELRRRGYTCVLWSVPLANDWEAVGAKTIAERVLSNVRDGSIVVLHDGDRGRPADRSATVEATPLVVEGLRARGLRLVTVPEMLAESDSR